MTQKIVPHLWYDKEAKEAALFYISLFDQSKLVSSYVLKDTPSGDAEAVNFILAGQPFASISAGPYFKFNPSISLMVSCESVDEIDTLWKALLDGGTELMPLDQYPFSSRYGWLQDRYGLSWQLILTDQGPSVQKITPNFLFSNDVCGKAEEAINFYTEVFPNSKIKSISRYSEGEVDSSNAKINYTSFHLNGMEFTAMDNAYDADFNFNEAFSLMINCKDQSEIDYYWDKLSAVPEAEQCGWIKDKYGVSWQIVPENMEELLARGSEEEMQRVFEASLQMKKFDLEALEKARQGY
ncbi:MAG: hypothetical protein K0S47_1672 [Herbinix sp.]|nr:hypothetical protein [Herbinix sp.]